MEAVIDTHSSLHIHRIGVSQSLFTFSSFLHTHETRECLSSVRAVVGVCVCPLCCDHLAPSSLSTIPSHIRVWNAQYIAVMPFIHATWRISLHLNHFILHIMPERHAKVSPEELAQNARFHFLIEPPGVGAGDSS